jgi:hypothetical protein
VRTKLKPLGLAGVDGGAPNSGDRGCKWGWMVAAAPLVRSAGRPGLTLHGQTSLIDGDTPVIHGTRNRLWGIDAPEAANSVAVTTAYRTDVERKYRPGRLACAQRPRSGLAGIFEAEVCRGATRCRTGWSRHMERQLRRTVAVPSLHPCEWYTAQLLRRCERSSVTTHT